ncbi:MAG: hypothetical protein DRP12_00165 [Candidatus Aenigmatarchaeota archaeon]|nr:MAG: hypothetical protein DRP12_00165 [Candidatus Aenigmarchaeota archaeon]
MVEAREVLQVIGGAAIGKGINELSRTYAPGEVSPGVPASRVINLGVGFASLAGSLFVRSLEKFSLPLASMGTYMLVEEIGNMAKEALVAPPARVARAPAPVVKVAAAPAPKPAAPAQFI